MSAAMEIGDPRHPGGRLAVTGRVTSAVSKIDSFTLKTRVLVSVAIDTPQNRRVAFVPAGRT